MRLPSTICRLPLETILRIYKFLLSHEGPNAAIRRDLVAVALNCHSLSEPAFDTLWHTIHTLAPLLRTLPEDLCTIAPFVSGAATCEAPLLRSVPEIIASSVRTSYAKSQFVSTMFVVARLGSR